MKIARGLIIDDQIDIHEILSERLSEFDFYSSFSVNEALVAVKKEVFNFVLLDYKLGGQQTGLDLVSEIKHLQPMAVIILISAYGTKEILQQAIEYQIDAYVDKPISYKELRNKLICLLDERGLLFKSSLIDSINSIKGNFQSDNYNISKVNLKSMADNHQKSYKYLSYKFKKETGKTFRQLKKETKYNKVMSLLRDTNLSIKEIASQCGFSNPTAVMQGFKNYTGQTMTAYRNREI